MLKKKSGYNCFRKTASAQQECSQTNTSKSTHLLHFRPIFKENSKVESVLICWNTERNLNKLKPDYETSEDPETVQNIRSSSSWLKLKMTKEHF